MDEPATIGARLAELRGLDAKRMVFGASQHGYRAAEPVDPALLAHVEALAGIPLPDDYRGFLTAIGDDALDQAARGGFAPENAWYSYLWYGDNPRYRVVPRTS